MRPMPRRQLRVCRGTGLRLKHIVVLRRTRARLPEALPKVPIVSIIRTG